MINNMPQLKMGIVSVSRDCFPMTLSATRRQRVVEAYNAKYETQTGKIYECPTCVENETHMRTALAQLKEAGCNALVVYLGNFGPETPETLLAKEFGGPVMLLRRQRRQAVILYRAGEMHTAVCLTQAIILSFAISAHIFLNIR